MLEWIKNNPPEFWTIISILTALAIGVPSLIFGIFQWRVAKKTGMEFLDFRTRMRNGINRIERSRTETAKLFDNASKATKDQDAKTALAVLMTAVTVKLSEMGKLIEPLTDELKTP